MSRFRVIAEGVDAPTSMKVRVVVRGEAGRLPCVMVERHLGPDAVDEKRWERLPEEQETRIAVGVIAAKGWFADAMGMADGAPLPEAEILAMREKAQGPNTVHAAATRIAH